MAFINPMPLATYPQGFFQPTSAYNRAQRLPLSVPQLPPLPITLYPESPLLPDAIKAGFLPLDEIIPPIPYKGTGGYVGPNPSHYTGMYETVTSPTFEFPKDFSR
jgi:hypothetical protein